MKHWPYPRWVAHRGAGKLAPENTLAGIRTAAPVLNSILLAALLTVADRS